MRDSDTDLILLFTELKDNIMRDSDTYLILCFLWIQQHLRCLVLNPLFL